MSLLKRILHACFAMPPLSDTNLSAMLLVREITTHLPGLNALNIVRVAYLCQVEHAGVHKTRLGDLVFEASTMGPMNTAVLKYAKRAHLYAKTG